MLAAEVMLPCRGCSPWTRSVDLDESRSTVYREWVSLALVALPIDVEVF
jgi:hypothetical protein